MSEIQSDQDLKKRTLYDNGVGKKWIKSFFLFAEMKPAETRFIKNIFVKKTVIVKKSYHWTTQLPSIYITFILKLVKGQLRW